MSVPTVFVVGILMLFVAVGWGFYGWRAWVLLVEPTLTKWEFNWQRRKIGLTRPGWWHVSAAQGIPAVHGREDVKVEEWNRKSFYQIRDYAWLDIDWRGI